MFKAFTRNVEKYVYSRTGLSTTSSFRPAFDPYLYTQGCWLDRDAERREAHKLHFNFNALLDIAINSSPGAQRVVACEKKEGGFNRVFPVHLDNGKTVVARIPTSLAGPPRLTVSSEVATLRFVKERTTVPVPTVLAWCSYKDNAVGSEYMITEAIPGVLLREVWAKMSASQHIRCIQSIGYIAQELCSLNFPTYGSLYLRTDEPPTAAVLDDCFSIGPLCAPHHWTGRTPLSVHDRGTPDCRGPWNTLSSYLSELFTKAHASASDDNSSGHDTAIPTETHEKLLDAAEQTIGLLSTLDEVSKDAARATLFHPDFHTRNIFVDPEDFTKVTGIIDWQSAAIEPAFVFAADTPDFAEEFSADPNLPEHDSDGKLTPAARLQADTEFCAKTWALVQQICPKYREASALDSSLVHLLAAPSTGWLTNPTNLQSILSRLRGRWKELELPGQSIYQPSESEEQDFITRQDEMQATRDLKEYLSRLLGCDIDGWVAADRWEEVLPRYREEYRRYIASFVEGLEDDGEKAAAIVRANALWPFDQR